MRPTADATKRLGVIIPLELAGGEVRRCVHSLSGWAGSLEILLVAMGPAESQRAQLLDLLRRSGISGQVLNQPSTDRAEAVNLGLSHARAELVLMLAPHLAAPADLMQRLEHHFGDDNVAGVGAGLGAFEDAPWPTRLAVEDFAFRTAELAVDPLPLIFAHCAAFRREELLNAGGLTPGEGADGGPLALVCARLAERGRLLVFDPDLRPLTDEPATSGQYLAGELALGKTLFQSRRRSQGAGAAPLMSRGLILQPLAALAALIAPIWFLPHAIDRALTISALCLLMLYPLNRAFLKQVAAREPGILNKALIMCLIRPFVWCAGMISAALGRLSGG